MGSPDSLGNHKPVLVLFDGVCNLCNGLVQFIIRRDPKAKFKFASLQSDAGRSLLKKFNIDTDLMHSIVVIDDDEALQRSDAVIRIANYLGGGWKTLKVFNFLPKFFRDACYNLVAANRYRIFGKKNSCMIPTPELKQRFIET
jgi:predicted DCC family thiol-disulfide oxidoreductase YuxK